MEVIWETVDRRGRLVNFREEAWLHILAQHSDFRIEQQDVRDVPELADEIVRDRTYRHREIHYRRYKSGPQWLRVVVHYRPHEHYGWVGDVITAHPIRKRKNDEVLLWPPHTPN